MKLSKPKTRRIFLGALLLRYQHQTGYVVVTFCHSTTPIGGFMAALPLFEPKTAVILWHLTFMEALKICRGFIGINRWQFNERCAGHQSCYVSCVVKIRVTFPGHGGQNTKKASFILLDGCVCTENQRECLRRSFGPGSFAAGGRWTMPEWTLKWWRRLKTLCISICWALSDLAGAILVRLPLARLRPLKCRFFSGLFICCLEFTVKKCPDCKKFLGPPHDPPPPAPPPPSSPSPSPSVPAPI